MTVAIKDHHVALSKAKISMMARPDSAFFTTICFSLPMSWDESVPTACTNGKEIRINPDYFMGLSTEEQVSFLIHESMHVAYLHMARVGTRVFRKYNIAADYVINLQLHERGFKINKNWLLDHQYAGLNAEEVYDKLPEDIKFPFECDFEANDDPDLNKDVEDILVRAQIQSKMSGDKPGTIPGDIQIFLNGLLNPKLPWHRILQKYLKSFDKYDYSFRKPNRRFFPKYHMPSLWGESLMDLTIAVDTSGSVSDHDFRVFISEVAGIFKMMKPGRITIIQFDTEIKSVETVKDIGELINIRFTGRGGTLITPVLEWAKENKPQLLMVFSDGGFNFYDHEFKGDTLWLVHNNPGWTAPWGKVIHYAID